MGVYWNREETIAERHIVFYLKEELIAVDVDWSKLESLAVIEPMYGWVSGQMCYVAYFEDEADEAEFIALLDFYEEHSIDESDVKIDE